MGHHSGDLQHGLHELGVEQVGVLGQYFWLATGGTLEEFINQPVVGIEFGAQGVGVHGSWVPCGGWGWELVVTVEALALLGGDGIGAGFEVLLEEAIALFLFPSYCLQAHPVIDGVWVKTSFAAIAYLHERTADQQRVLHHQR